ncbi:MAG: transposase [Cytophagales bacterium]|nr:transposase [Cytophagales bacterium]
MNSTEFKLPPNMSNVFPGYGGDGTQSCAQIQLEYEVFNHKITHLHIGNSLESDRTEGMRHLDTIPKKTLLLRDLGYYNIGNLRTIGEEDIFYISRLHSQISIYTKSEGSFKRITHQEILEKRRTKSILT